jgi:glyoxylase-like metal-dependent hydrolase (beta-lactamase superfamily II)
VVISGGQAAVVDPSVPCEVYELLAGEHGARISAVLETHVHADHVSRGHELARRTGAPIYIPAQNRVKLPFQPLVDGAEIRVGEATIRCIATPGHTPESVSYLVDGAALLSGDTLFVEGVGRPDLKAEGDESRDRARLLYHSLTERVFALAPQVIVLPCHSPEPLAFDGQPHSATLAQARAASGMAGQTEDAFVSDVLSRIPPTPPNHLHIVRINEGLDPAPDDLASLEAGANRCAISVR